MSQEQITKVKNKEKMSGKIQILEKNLGENCDLILPNDLIENTKGLVCTIFHPVFDSSRFFILKILGHYENLNIIPLIVDHCSVGYELNEKGREHIIWNKGVCVGRRDVTEIVEYTEPADMMGKAFTEVKIKNVNYVKATIEKKFDSYLKRERVFISIESIPKEKLEKVVFPILGPIYDKIIKIFKECRGKRLIEAYIKIYKEIFEIELIPAQDWLREKYKIAKEKAKKGDIESKRKIVLLYEVIKLLKNDNYYYPTRSDGYLCSYEAALGIKEKNGELILEESLFERDEAVIKAPIALLMLILFSDYQHYGSSYEYPQILIEKLKTVKKCKSELSDLCNHLINLLKKMPDGDNQKVKVEISNQSALVLKALEKNGKVEISPKYLINKIKSKKYPYYYISF